MKILTIVLCVLPLSLGGCVHKSEYNAESHIVISKDALVCKTVSTEIETTQHRQGISHVLTTREHCIFERESSRTVSKEDLEKQQMLKEKLEAVVITK